MRLPCPECGMLIPEGRYCCTHVIYNVGIVYYLWYEGQYSTEVYYLYKKIFSVNKWIDLARVERLMLLK
jgi:hypothetical protein